MNWRIRRVRLEAVGPRDARYDDITLSFISEGRAAPNAVLLLRNGGGKSLLLSLLFKALLPRRADGTKSASDQRDARPIVEPDECATVAIEWEHRDDGRLLVTGHSFERGEGSEMRWLFESRADVLTLDNLPLRDGTRRRTLAGVLSALDASNKANSRLRYQAIPGVKAWEDELESYGLDPAILRYQARLNRREGGDDEQLRFRDPEAFVRFVLQMVLDDEPLAALQDAVAKHADKLAQRGALVAEAELCRDIAAALKRLADAHDALVATQAGHTAAEGRMAEKAGAMLAARIQADALIVQIAQRREPLTQRRAALETRRRDLRRETSVVTARTAELRAEAARSQHASAAQSAEAADREHQAWVLVAQLIELHEVEGRRTALRQQLDAAAEGLQEAQRQRAEAAARLAAALLHEAARVAQLAHQEHDATAADEAEAERLAQVADETRRRRTDALTERAGTQVRLDAFERATQALRDDGVLQRDERPSAAAERFTTELNDLTERDAVLAERIGSLSTRADEVETAMERERLAAAAHQTHMGRVDSERTAAIAATDAALDEAVRDTIDVSAEWQPLAEPAGAVQALDRARSGADVRRAASENQIDALTADEQALAADRLLPVEADIAYACDVLDGIGIQAFSALRYLAQAEGLDARRAAIAAHPGLAAGIVVLNGDPHDAVAALEQAGARLPRRPLIIAAPAALTGDNGRTRTAVVHPAEAAYDPKAAEAAEAEVAQALDEQRQRRDEHRALADRLGRAELVVDAQAKRLRELLPATSVGDRQLLQAIARHRESVVRELEAATARAETQKQTLDSVTADLEAAEQDRAELRAALHRAEAAVQRLSHLDDVDVVAARAELDRLTGVAARLAGEAGAAQDARDASVRSAEGHRQRGEGHEAQEASLRAQAGGLLSGDQAIVPEAGSLAQLQSALDTAEAAVEERIPDEALRDRWAGAEKRAKRLGGELANVGLDVRERADALTGSAAGTDREVLARGTRDAKAAYEAALVHVGAAKAAAKDAADDHAAAHQAISTEDYARAPKILTSLSPADETEGERWLAQLGELRDACDKDVETCDAQLAEAEQRSEDAQRLVRELDDAVGRLGAVVPRPHSGPPPAWTARRDAIRDHASAAVNELERATRAQTIAQGVEAQALQSVTDRMNTADERVPTGTLAGLRVGEALAAEAAEHEAQMRTRAGEIDRQLADLEGHRAAIVSQLLIIGAEGGRKVDRVAKATRLPNEPTLGPWSAKQFARVQHGEVADEMAREHRVGQVLDRAVATTARRRGQDLAFDATMALFDNKITVTVLKPHPQPDDQYHPIEKVGPEFSGGEELTIKLILFCAVSAVRAAGRAGRSRGGYRAGPLLIDNPIGTASRESLVDLQLRLALHLEAQFIPFTALEQELNLTGRFAAVVALTNDQDLLSGARYVIHDGDGAETIAPRRPDDTPGDASVLSAIAYAPAIDVSELADSARDRRPGA